MDTCRGKVPIIAGAGGPTRTAIAHAQEAERLGAHGILLLPHYLTEAGQEGLIAHVEQICKSVQFGVIVYNRDRTKFTPESLAILAERCPNLIGFKDGMGNIETHVQHLHEDGRPLRLPGRPAHGRGVCRRLQGAGHAGVFVRRLQLHPEDRDGSSTKRCAPTTWPRSTSLLKQFFMPYLKIRNRVEGYGVSIIKAGATLVGHGAGPVRAPLSDLKPGEMDELKALIDALGQQ